RRRPAAPAAEDAHLERLRRRGHPLDPLGLERGLHRRAVGGRGGHGRERTRPRGRDGAAPAGRRAATGPHAWPPLPVRRRTATPAATTPPTTAPAAIAV